MLPLRPSQGANTIQSIRDLEKIRQIKELQLARCLEYLRSGDTLLIWKLDRIGRTTKQLIELSHDLKERGISLQIITLGVDTSTPAGKLFFRYYGWFS